MSLTSPQDIRSLTSRPGTVLSLAVLGLWGLLAFPAWWMRGSVGLEGMTYAALLCLVPGWLVVFVNARYPDSRSPAMAILLGLGTRMAFALIGVLSLINLRTDLFWNEQRQMDLMRFVAWLLCYYFCVLFLETLLMVGGREKKSTCD
jgi:hypothetical protein